MHLINVHTRSLEEFHENPPEYAILSHTWGPEEEEITFREMKGGDLNKPGIGTTKLEGCLQQAKTDKVDYVWIDTCCIDQSSSHELSFAIRSMFQWYQLAKKCYTYLQDVPSKANSRWKSKFRKSRWFTRGWTLQELLAPKELNFYSHDWQALGTKQELSDVVWDITGIPAQFLRGDSGLEEASVAQRMSWASNRKTKRVEDIAYSLLGIFGVSMVLMYGEGDHAFIRLQESIIDKTPDDSILAWGFKVRSSRNMLRHKVGGILAPSITAFAGCGKITWKNIGHATMDVKLLRGKFKLQLPLQSTKSKGTYGILRTQLNNPVVVDRRCV
ncbi:heterokaryon incompatibility protein-domain-containing protein [Colletotrichum godetiae]|uniref:Heterokaryon incompatibility protein-domain-containing protein n=1 Tax=Colletotrichum godetiae TaxID=1209918 RepID=A0AAJ0AYY5_9PEZI|nr:heterokaryon incompatibility protein-domain-containing protein [Colletotrichum godetiae]KAK1700879.1 heterokaryon incompatibility protein-domain-containing protein [Colletotrichum godetiae]